MSTISDSTVISALDLVSREFERVRSRLLEVDEPGPDEVTGAVAGESRLQAQDAAEPTEEDSDGGFLSKVGAVARFARTTVTGKVHPRHADWAGASLDDRVDWWVDRLGTAVASLAALPSLGGRLLNATGVGDALGGAGQLLVINAVGHEMGVTDQAQLVRVGAKVVLGRDLDLDTVRAQLAGRDAAVPDSTVPDSTTPDSAVPDSATDQPLPEEEAADEDERRGLARLGGTARIVWRTARQLRSLDTELDRRPQGGFLVRALRNVPGVGVAGGFLAERSGVAEAAELAQEAFASRPR